MSRVRVALAFLAALLPLLAAGCAPHAELAGPPVIDPSMNAQRIVAADGFRLPLRVWEPEDDPVAVAVALHGFNDYSSAFDDPATAWAEHGIVTYAYDQRGFGATESHGLWPGIETLVNDLHMVVRLLHARHPGLPVYVVGESMGGAVTMVALTRPDAPEVAGAVLVAPAVRGRHAMWPWERAALWLLAHTAPSLELTGRGLVTPSDNIPMLRRASRDPLFIKETRVDAVWGLVDLMDAAMEAAKDFDNRALILYGVRDELVPPRAIAPMLERLPPVSVERRKVAVYDTGYHMLFRDLRADIVVRDVVSWMRDPRQPLPSDAESRAEVWLARQ